MSDTPKPIISPLVQVREICQVPPNVFGNEYLEHLARRTSECLGVDYVLIGSTSLNAHGSVDTKCDVEVVVPMLDGQLAQRFSYSLKDTPCLQVMSNERVCSYYGDVQDRFPRDLDLVELEATSYVGAPILGPDGELKGIFAVLNRSDLNLEQDLVAVIEFLGARAGIEFHRIEQMRDVAAQQEMDLQQDKLLSLGRLAGGIAHDFNNLLSSIMGHAELLEVSPSKASIETILQAAAQGKALTQQLLDVARPIGPRRSGCCDMVSVVYTTCELVKRATHLPIQFDFDMCAEELWVGMSSSALQQVVMNLVLNARDASPEGAPIYVRTRAEDLGASVRVLEIEDKGHGIESTELSKIFEPFYTTKTTTRGTGLGLATVNGLVRAHGGAIRVESVVGRGTIMRLDLLEGHPEVQEVQVQEAQAHTQGVDSNKGLWLVIEDEVAIRDVLKSLLEHRGYDSLVAASTQDATLKLSQTSQTVSGVVSDLNLGGAGAYSFLCQFREDYPELPIIVITGDPTTDEAIKVQEISDTRLLSKPFRIEELLPLLESH